MGIAYDGQRSIRRCKVLLIIYRKHSIITQQGLCLCATYSSTWGEAIHIATPILIHHHNLVVRKAMHIIRLPLVMEHPLWRFEGIDAVTRTQTHYALLSAQQRTDVL